MRPALVIAAFVSISSAALARPGDVDAPLLIPSTPFVHRGSTAGRSSNITNYACASTTSEAGPEVAYQFRAPSAGRLTASVEGDNGTVDVDAQILTSLRTDASRKALDCAARGDRIAEAHIAAGDVFVVVDTYQSASRAGTYTLRVDFKPDDDWYARPVARGVTLKTKSYADLFGARQSTSVIDIDLAEPSVVIKPILATTCATTSSLARAAGAVAAINAGFFDTSTGRCGSVSLVKIDGQLFARNAKSRSAFGLTANRQPLIERVAAGADWPAAWSAVGGVPRIVSAGRTDIKTVDEGSPLSFETSRHPRTAVGIGANGTVSFTTVDGRTAAGAGMMLPELAQWMVWLGIADAVNMDGGGSTTMWVRGEPWGGVVNYPSDNGRADHAGERAVGSALAVWAAPLDRDVAWLTSPPATVRLRAGETWSFEVVVADPEGRAVAIREAASPGASASGARVLDRGEGTAHFEFAARAGDGARSPIAVQLQVAVAAGRTFSKTVSITVDAPGTGVGPDADAGQPSIADAGVSAAPDAGRDEPGATDAGSSPLFADAGASHFPPTSEPRDSRGAANSATDETSGCATMPVSPHGNEAAWLLVAAALAAIPVSRRRGKARVKTRFARDRL